MGKFELILNPGSDSNKRGSNEMVNEYRGWSFDAMIVHKRSVDHGWKSNH
jgi:hypothetical protein